MSASTFKRFTQSAFGQFNSAESAAVVASPAAAKFGAFSAQASAGLAADSADAVSLNAAESTSWIVDAKAIGLSAVPW